MATDIGGHFATVTPCRDKCAGKFGMKASGLLAGNGYERLIEFIGAMRRMGDLRMRRISLRLTGSSGLRV